jgi:ABC-type glycerol-3-phosphate transport system substrate-binding protein
MIGYARERAAGARPGGRPVVRQALPQGGSGLRTRRRVLGALGLGSLGAVVQAGCGGFAPPGAPPSGQAAPQTIRFAYWVQDYKPFWDQIFPTFTEKTNIKVELEFYASGAAWGEKMIALFASDSAPEAAHSVSHVDTRLYDQGNILDLEPAVKVEKLNIDRDYVLMGTERWCGKLYALPYFAEPFAIYFNKSMARQIGQPDPWQTVKGDWTWEQMMTMAKAATADTDRDGAIDQWGIYWPYTPPAYFGPWAWTAGANFVDWDAAKYTFGAPGSVQAFQQLQTAIMRERSVLHQDEVTAALERWGGGVKNVWQAGHALFWFRSVTDIPRNRLQVGTNFEWDVLPVPKLDNARPGVSLQAGHPNWVNAKTQLRDAAVKFTLWLSQSESQDHMGETKFLMPALKSSWTRFLKASNAGEPPEHIQVFADVFKKPHGWHFRSYTTYDAEAVYGPAVHAIMRGERPLAAGLQEMSDLMNQRLEFGSCAPYRGQKVPRPPAS